MKRFAMHLRAHPHLLASLAVGVLVAVLFPGEHVPRSRVLVGWNAAVWLYLALAAWAMLRAGPSRIRRVAKAQAEGAATVLVIVIVAALVSLAGTVFELSAAKMPGALPGAKSALPHVALALSTVVGSWLLLPVEFALAYASLYHRGTGKPSGLAFPGDDEYPDYTDFMYFAVTLAATSQTSDVSVNTRPMRRLVLLHAVLSFVFNTSVLALTINILAGLIS